MKKALIIGGAGFVGQYLSDYLANTCKYSVTVTKTEHETYENKDISVYDLDLLNIKSINNVLAESNPDMIFHLAAQSSIALSWEKPQLTVDVNIKGTINLLEAVRRLELKPRMLLIGSGEEYGHITENVVPINEVQPLNPANIYSATKVCQEMLGKIYAKAYDMDIVMTRSFNHFGPKQSPQFVISDFCKQVAEIEKGLKGPVIHVGNLSAKRDFLDVRDVIVAYNLLINKGKQGEVYNVGSGKALTISGILDTILSLAKVKITVQVDQAKLRPVDIPIIEADITKLKNATGWAPSFEMEHTISGTLDYWRGVL